MTLTPSIRLDPDSPPDETLQITVSGLPVLIYNITGGGRRPIHGAIYIDDRWEPRSWLVGGRYESSGVANAFDLRARAPVKRGVWVARWLSHLGAEYLTHHDTKEGACDPSIYPSPKLLSVTYCADGDGLNPADPPLWVDWAMLPDWAEWAAADADGQAHAYEIEPRDNQSCWDTNHRWTPLLRAQYRLAPGFDWRETLTQRPEVQDD